ncbi:MAG: aminotransferase class I/II-fold pyridoxal phosphate-dependent enzyme, partial [Coriobacteriia bacterium]|nr:aminotransferase class I/II-fold pyridoxal phosphate-dependent enzyme [Coriobacteriia bacterium]
ATPQFIVDAMVEALRDQKNHHYPAYVGSARYRMAAAAYLRNRFNVEVDAQTEVLALIGSKEGIVHLGNAFIDEGDFALVPSIGYPAYSAAATLRNAKCWCMPTTEKNGYLADFRNIPEEVLNRSKVMFLGYPNNPTGASAPEGYFDEAIAFCREHDILLAHDNAYCDICFDGYQAPSVLQRPGAREVAIEFFSLSKGYNMTGWRIGFAVGNAQAIKALASVKSNIDTGVFNAIQQAGVAALESDQSCVRANCAAYERRRNMVVPALNEMGLACAYPKATIYVWARIPQGYTSAAFADHVLQNAHVAVTPGSGYGEDGEGFIRISLAVPDERLAEALRRMQQLLSDGD